MKNIFTFIVLFKILFLLTSCGQYDVAEMEAVQLSVDQNGSLIVELETDQRLDINLEGNPTTGYTWEIMNIDKRILLQESEKFKPESDLEGSPGLFVFRLMAVEKGQTDIVLIYHRPWEKEVEPLSTFFIKVIVR